MWLSVPPTNVARIATTTNSFGINISNAYNGISYFAHPDERSSIDGEGGLCKHPSNYKEACWTADEAKRHPRIGLTTDFGLLRDHSPNYCYWDLKIRDMPADLTATGIEGRAMMICDRYETVEFITPLLDNTNYLYNPDGLSRRAVANFGRPVTRLRALQLARCRYGQMRLDDVNPITPENLERHLVLIWNGVLQPPLQTVAPTEIFEKDDTDAAGTEDTEEDSTDSEDNEKDLFKFV